MARLHAMWVDGNVPHTDAPSVSADSVAAESTAAGPASIGRFEIERELGHGGAGIVLLARSEAGAARGALRCRALKD